MMEDPRIAKVAAARADAYRRHVIEMGVRTKIFSFNERALGTSSTEVLMRLAPLPVLDRMRAQMVILTVGTLLGFVTIDAAGNFKTADPYQLGSATQ